ncbi:MAG: metal-dependent phosphohydrolase [Thermoanaerobaculia bacterium]|nr:metal-dependent phosphohydrolase [Thermoanaerobaculia bacterium]
MTDLGRFIQLGNGRAYSFASPGPIPIAVVARSLSRLCRFTGHLREFYSVAQHSCLVSSLVAPELRAHALLHDASETVISDISSPLKAAIGAHDGGFLRELEDNIHSAILAGFGLEPLDDAGERAVKLADEFAVCAEVRDLMTPGERSLELPHGFAVVAHVPRITRTWAPDEGEARFLERWAEVRP